MPAVKVRNFKRRRAAKSHVVTKEVMTPSGRTVSIRSIPANGPSFKDDFLRVFSENVKEATRAKKHPRRTPRAIADT